MAVVRWLGIGGLQSRYQRTAPVGGGRSLECLPRADATGSLAKKHQLFDHLVSARKQGVWYVEADRLGCLQVDHQLELGRVLDRQLSRLLALQNAIDVPPGAPVEVDVVDAVGRQPAADDVVTERED